jgi:hypothetical protein
MKRRKFFTFIGCAAAALTVAAITSTEAAADCEMQFLEANATFIRATVHCKRDYMDTPAGFYALAMTRQCKDLSEEELFKVGMAAMLKLDGLAKEKGKAAACKWVDELEKAIVSDVIR